MLRKVLSILIKGMNEMIYCVDDDDTIRDIEVYTLKQMGFEAKGFDNGITMLESLEHELPQLIILDIMMPNLDGVEVLKRLKENARTQSIPVIMASAKGQEMDKINSLDIGADDYLVKPFGIMEMVSRVKAVLRRCNHQVDVLTYKDLSLYRQEREVVVNDKKINLTYKEFELLQLLMQSPRIVLSREQIIQQVWGLDFLGESRTVDMHIKTLRQKLGYAGKYIQTVIGIGYKLEAKDE